MKNNINTYLCKLFFFVTFSDFYLQWFVRKSAMTGKPIDENRIDFLRRGNFIR